MKILSIYDGHNSGATLLENWNIVASISEERLSRFKNDVGYPKRAIDAVLKIGKINPEEVDKVILSSVFMHQADFYLDWNWYKKGEKEQFEEEQREPERRDYFLNKRITERKNNICKHLGIDADKIMILDHHTAHAATAYFGSHFNSNEKVLVLTLDGSGDGISSTVSIAENGKIKRIAQSKNSASLGKIFSRVTYLLGMKPWEHEYKIMGLAPYSDEKGVEKSYDVLSKLIKVEGLEFKSKSYLSTNYCYHFLKDNLENHRFDWIAGAVQKLQEELVLQWVKNAVEETGIKKIAAAGGSFMNVKTNMKILELEQVDDLFVFPSCGDESLSIGAAFWLSNNLGEKTEPFKNNYLGMVFSSEEIEKALNACNEYKIEKLEDINSKVANLLASGEIVARFEGRMEWGARALGNRSIIMNPRNVEKVKELNKAIKKRDFWMPFAPTVLKEREQDYLVNPKSIRSPYMTIAFPTTEKGRKDLSAATHAYDSTARPQILEKEFNPQYYDLIKKFESLTGIGAVLNTSFNLHGEPIVCSPEDALKTFENSGLKYLALNNYLVSKK